MKMGNLLRSTLIIAAAFAACDYGSSTITGSGGPPLTPAVNISGPAWGSTVMIGNDDLVTVTFTTSNFRLAMPGTCAGDPACGHVHLKIDGAACNNTVAMKPYNVAGYASPISGNLGFCPNVDGQHDMVLELHHDDHSPVVDNKGTAIGANAQFIAQRQSTQAAPTITISEPTANATVTMAAGNTVPVSFMVTNFLLKAPGTCLATDGACGHVHVKVDANACNNTAAQKPYNNAGFASPINANLSFCTMPAGSHTISLELHNNDHTPVLDPTSGLVISASVGIISQ
jgi:hypothetical protein